MRIDLSGIYSEGLTLLPTWRNRYPKQIYPEKVILNIFYRKYTIEFMWSGIVANFKDHGEFQNEFSKMKSFYEDTAVTKTQPVLLDLIKNQSGRQVGGVTYENFNEIEKEARSGNAKALEELEFSYLYHLLIDECVLVWSALGGTGLNYNEAISKMTGYILKPSESYSYTQMENIFGQLCAAPFLEKEYNPMPPIF